MNRYTLAQARFILSHVYCVHHLPDAERGGMLYPLATGFGEAICSRCSCTLVADLRLHVASVSEAEAWRAQENAAIDAFNASKAVAP